MWQRFTERSRRVILLAQEEARLMEAGEVRTEHLLLGLMREDEGVAAKILAKMGVKAASVRIEIAIESTPSQNLSEDEPLLTLKAKRVLELAADESRRFRHNYIGTEHLLLALLREKDGVAATVLQRLGFNLEEVRAQVMEYLSPTATPTATPTAPEKTPDVTTDFLRGAVELAKNIGKNPDLAAVSPWKICARRALESRICASKPAHSARPMAKLRDRKKGFRRAPNSLWNALTRRPKRAIFVLSARNICCLDFWGQRRIGARNGNFAARN